MNQNQDSVSKNGKGEQQGMCVEDEAQVLFGYILITREIRCHFTTTDNSIQNAFITTTLSHCFY